MATAIILILLVLIVIFGIKSYVKRLSSGCCGSGGDTVKREKPQDRDESHYPYTYVFTADGMHCQNCVRQIENAFVAQNCLCKVALKTQTVHVRAKSPLPRQALQEIVTRAGYDFLELQSE